MTTADPAAPAAARPPEPARVRRARWAVIRAIVAKDLIAVRRAKAVVIPMLAVPVLLMVVLPFGVGLAARGQDGGTDLRRILDSMPGDLAEPILSLPQHEQLVVLVNGYLLAPLFLIVPLMVSAVLAADAFAGEKERKTLESLLHLPIPDRDLFVAKLLTAFLPAVAVSWIGFAAFCLVANGVAWPVMHRVFVPTQLWLVMIFWLGPAVAMLGLAVMVRVSARTKTAQEANQLGGAVILPLIFLSVGQASGILLVTLPVALAIGAAVWALALVLVRGGMKRFTRDRLAARV
ncbi:MAG TPA: ABC transporter permease subunit [Acidimicrobiales bacterium]|nr:ABC transporter permease subunit [Acidimicrobiales bacterium]